MYSTLTVIVSNYIKSKMIYGRKKFKYGKYLLPLKNPGGQHIDD